MDFWIETLLNLMVGYQHIGGPYLNRHYGDRMMMMMMMTTTTTTTTKRPRKMLVFKVHVVVFWTATQCRGNLPHH